MPRATHETPLDWYKAATDPKLTRLAKIYEQYQERLLQANALDFDDLLLETVRLLKHDEALRALVQPALRIRDDRRVSGHEPQPVRADAVADPRRGTTSASSATKISRSMAGAARISATFWISSAIIRMRW